MSKIDDIANEIHDNNNQLAKMAKDRAFDLIAVGLVFSVALISLGAIELRNITVKEVLNLLLEAVPFYLASVTLSLNFYKKGVYTAKATEQFINTVKSYSHRVNQLTGHMLDCINDFCSDYNLAAIKLKQQAILYTVAISYERYNDVSYDKDGNEIKPLRQLSKKEIVKLYNERVADKVMEANEITIKGLNPNTLLGSNDNWDITDLGQTEQELLKKRSNSYIGGNAISILLLTVMTIKDIIEWGWEGIFLVIFKLVFILCRCYMKYFEGFEDITQKVSNYISRKIDIIKQFDYWYSEKFSNNSTEMANVGNNSENFSYNIIEAEKPVTTETRPKTLQQE